MSLDPEGRRRGSLDTNASGLTNAASAISFSAFPAVPNHTPTPTPTRTEFSFRSLPQPPLTPSLGKPTISPTRSAHSIKQPSQVSSTRNLSSYDWHDGASSIGVDATEDRLLSASFITSLLKDGHDDPDGDTRTEASQVSYPVPQSRSTPYRASIKRVPSARRPPPLELSRRKSLPHSTIAQVLESPERMSMSEESLSTDLDHKNVHSTIRTASVSRAIPATMRVVSKGSIPDLPQVDPSLAVHPHSLQVSHDTNSRPSFHSRSGSLISSSSRSASIIRRIVDSFSGRPKPLPPVPMLTPNRDIGHQRSLHKHRSLVPTVEGTNQHTWHYTHGTVSPSSWGHGTLDSSKVLWGGGQARDGLDFNDKPSRDEMIPTLRRNVPMSRKKKRVIILLCILAVVAIAAIAASVSVTLTRKASSASSCSSGSAGSSCNLNSTCVCTSQSPGRCDGLAQNLIDLIPSVNANFKANFTSSIMYNSFWVAQGTVGRGDCSSQSVLVDVAPALNSQTSPERVSWAQAALLWNLVQTQDISSAKKLQQFVQNAPWTTLPSPDGAVNEDSSFSVTVAGFTYNFASQNVSLPSTSFVTSGSPSSAQVAEVGQGARTALDRMYSYAQASSTQRQQSLTTYWTTVMQQKSDDLQTFISAFSNSPILIPFDAESQQISALLKPNSSFPPPLSCYPGLSNGQMQRINAIESTVFALPDTTSPSNFDSSCYPTRPIYGRLDILRLRLPFLDSQSGTAKQAAVLNREVNPRAVIYPWSILSDLPQNIASTSATLSIPQLDARQYGTLNLPHHVILSYLSSITDPNVSSALVQYLLSSPTSPPQNTSALIQSLSSLPVVEVAVFGTVSSADISSVASSFATKDGGVFFGSAQAGTLRDFALNVGNKVLVWAESATSALVARQVSTSDSTFNDAWNAANKALTSGVSITVSQITSSLASTGYLTNGYSFK